MAKRKRAKNPPKYEATFPAKGHGVFKGAVKTHLDRNGEWVWEDVTFDLDQLAKSQQAWKRPRDVRTPYVPTGTRVGATVTFTRLICATCGYKFCDMHDPSSLSGQVWSEGHKTNSVWVVNDQRAYLVNKETMEEMERY